MCCLHRQMNILPFNRFIAFGSARFSATILSIVFGFQSHENSPRMHEYHPHFLATVDPILKQQFYIIFIYRRSAKCKQKISKMEQIEKS